VGQPAKVTCCQACVYGRGDHAWWCKQHRNYETLKRWIEDVLDNDYDP